MTAIRCLVLFAALASISAAPPAKEKVPTKWSGDYVILLPKALRSSEEYTILVQIQSKNVGLRIDTTDPDTKKTVRGKVSVFPDGNGSIKYRLPFKNFDGKAVKISCTAFPCAGDVKKCKGGSAIISQIVTLPVLKEAMMIFTETSKPIYKPGETVKFRILPLTPSSLRPTVDNDGERKGLVFDLIYVEAPNKMRMAQWKNVTWQQALKGLSFALSADPLYGTWKIKSQLRGVKDEETFKVKEYVLPKFTVSLKLPSYTVVDDEFVKFSVCAKYTTGRFMKGLVKARFCIKEPSYARRKKRPCLNVMKVLDGTKACANFNESTEPLMLWNKRYQYWGSTAFLNATVIENGTEMSITKVKSGGQLTTQPYKIIANLPDTYRSGLPVYAKVKVEYPDGSPRSNIKVVCKVTSFFGMHWGYEETFSTDKNGVINFGIPPFPPNSGSVSLSFNIPQSEYQKKQKSNRPKDATVRPYISTEYQNIAKYYSPSGTSMQVYPLYKTAPQDPCSSGKLLVTLQSNVPLFNKVIHSVSISRGGLQSTQSFGKVAVPEIMCEDQDDEALGHYKCVPQKDGTMKIRCLPGWKGDNCLTAICEQGCVKGSCGSPGKCICQRGWIGEACNKCVVRKQCVNGYCHFGDDCICKPNYFGYLCDRKKKKPYVHFRPPRPPIDELNITKPAAYDPSTQLEERRLFARQLEIPVSPQLYPSSQIVMWFSYETKDGGRELVTSRVKLDDLQDCLNKLTPTAFSFDKKTVRPGENVTATIKTTGKSPSCALAVSDIALDTFGTRGGISQSTLVEEIQSAADTIQQWHYLDPYNVLRNEYCRRKRLLPPRLPRSIMPYGPQMKDASAFFRDAGIFVVSNIPLMTAPCRTYFLRRMGLGAPPSAMAEDARAPQAVGMTGPTPKQKSKAIKKMKKKIKARVRTFFPETWKFELLEDPKSKLTLKAPDSMTTWKSTMYCVSSKGLGLSPSDRLVVFQPFFLQMSLPYALIRGETARIPVKVFSYRKECSEITLTMKPSKDLKSNGPQVARSCVCNFDHITAYFRVQPKVLGKVPIEVEAVSRPSMRCPNPKPAKPVPVVADAVRRPLLIKPEGIPEEISVGDLLCPDGKSASIHLTLRAPKETGLSITEGSERAYFTWSGNVIGSSMENLDSMVRMPYGCGEQNMMSMVPSIYVLDYFTKAGIKKAQVMDKARKFIGIGYQRQLKYRLDDGSYSAFGKRDKVGSTWLTAFVFKSFAAARQYATIDNKILTSALNFLLSKARPDGCFREDGRVFSSSLKGGQGRGKDEVSITAYILSALLEAQNIDKTLVNATAPGITAALRCLNTTTSGNATDMKNLSNFAVAMRTYALTMWNATHNSTKRFQNELRRRKISKDGFEYWKANNKEVLGIYCRPWSYFVSADVETTAYALLSKLAVKGRGGRKLVKVLPTLRWLTSQRNERGGWYSTQDTITALQALSTFASRTSLSGTGTNLDVTIKVGNGKVQKVKVDNDNRLVLSKMAVDVPSSLSVTARGSGCLVVQAIVLFNVKDIGRKGAPFSLSAHAMQNINKCDEAKVRVCARYTGASKQSSMAVIKAQMSSGWQTTKASIQKLNKNITDGGLKLIEVDSEKSLVLYFDYFTATNSCIEFSVEREIEVADVKPMIIQVYDYYKPHETQEKNVQVVNKACGKSPQRPQNDGTKAKCPVCTTVNDTAVSAIERICAKVHYFGAAQRDTDKSQKWEITQRVGDMIMMWNGAVTVPKGCSCPLSKRVIVGLHTRWWAMKMDEDVKLDMDWTVINVDSLSAEGHMKLMKSCASKSQGFRFLYRMFANQLDEINKKKKKSGEKKGKALMEPPQPGADDPGLFGPKIEPPESMCFVCSEHIDPEMRSTLSADIASNSLTIVRVNETKRDKEVVWTFKDPKGNSIERKVNYRKECAQQCKYQGSPPGDKDLLVISRVLWKLKFDTLTEAIVPDGSFYIDEYSKMTTLFPKLKQEKDERSKESA